VTNRLLWPRVSCCVPGGPHCLTLNSRELGRAFLSNAFSWASPSSSGQEEAAKSPGPRVFLLNPLKAPRRSPSFTTNFVNPVPRYPNNEHSFTFTRWNGWRLPAISFSSDADLYSIQPTTSLTTSLLGSTCPVTHFSSWSFTPRPYPTLSREHNQLTMHHRLGPFVTAGSQFIVILMIDRAIERIIIHLRMRKASPCIPETEIY